jgi:hypothetical protein
MKPKSLNTLASALGYAGYEAYLRSDHWAAFRVQILRGSRNCRVCGGPARVVHHMTYDRLGNESPGDVVVVCAPCHDLIHVVHRTRKIPLRRFEAAARLVRRMLSEDAPDIAPAPARKAPTPPKPSGPVGPPFGDEMFARRHLLRKLLAADYSVGWVCRRYRWHKGQAVALAAWIKAHGTEP